MWQVHHISKIIWLSRCGSPQNSEILKRQKISEVKARPDRHASKTRWKTAGTLEMTAIPICNNLSHWDEGGLSHVMTFKKRTKTNRYICSFTWQAWNLRRTGRCLAGGTANVTIENGHPPRHLENGVDGPSLDRRGKPDVTFCKNDLIRSVSVRKTDAANMLSVRKCAGWKS